MSLSLEIQGLRRDGADVALPDPYDLRALRTHPLQCRALGDGGHTQVYNGGGSMASPLNPIELVGGDGHRPDVVSLAPGESDRDTRVEVVKA